MKHEQHYSTPFALFSRKSHLVRVFLRSITIVSAISVLAACGNSTEVENNTNPGNGGGNGNLGPAYLGPAALTDEIQRFKTEFWNPLAANDRCGQCHTPGGQGENFTFVNLLDINKAFSAATSTNNLNQLIVDLNNPSLSRAVVKVREGHQCWLGNDPSTSGACADIIEGYISNWTSNTLKTGGRSITLEAPTYIKDPGKSRNFPATPDAFIATLYTPVLVKYCSECHSDSSDTPQAPFFASADTDVAYAAAMSKINLDALTGTAPSLSPLPIDSAEQSRFVTRVLELHNCWTADCASDADVMRLAIFDFAKDITLTEIDPRLVTSKAMNFQNATLASGGNRYENDQIAIWEFKRGTGTVAFDTSGIEPAINLEFHGSVSWILGYGLQFSNGGYAEATGTSEKLANLIAPNNRYSIEAWIIPANVTQEDARIISYAPGGGTTRNFSMSQTLYQYQFLNRATNNTENSDGSLITFDQDEDLQSALQHVVYTYDPVNGRRIYVNGVFTEDTDSADMLGGSLLEWDNSFNFVLGSEGSSNNAWNGKLRMVAIHNNVLSQDQIAQNFKVGVGQKYFMLFSVSDLLLSELQVDERDVFVMMQAELYDNTAYLFNNPVFINLNGDYVPSKSIPLEGMRIGINGKEAVTGQVFGNITMNINASDYTVDGQTISRLGTVIPVGKGPDNDEFFLTFDNLNGNTTVRDAEVFATPATLPEAAPVSEIGVKTFDEINASMSIVTRVPVTQTDVVNTYQSYKQQLPSIEDISAFLPSHQMAIAQLAMQYCNVRVTLDKDPQTLANDVFFKGFDFSQTALTAFTGASASTNISQIIDPLLTGIMNMDAHNLASQADPAIVTELLGSTNTLNLVDDVRDANSSALYDYSSLISTMTSCATCSNTTKRTEEIVIATCAATLGSAMILIQ